MVGSFCRLLRKMRLRSIPVIVLTSSEAEKDILESYNLHANCYIVKPVEWGKFVETIKSLDCFEHRCEFASMREKEEQLKQELAYYAKILRTSVIGCPTIFKDLA